MTAQDELRRTVALYAKARSMEEKANDAFDRLTEELFSELSAREWREFYLHNGKLFERVVRKPTRYAFEVATLMKALEILEGRTC
jgi:uncharacterized protein YktB (UPF0637 family)